jgi:hypothetical protein
MVIDEIYLVGIKMLSFIDCKIRVIQQIHKKFMGDFDVIMVDDFYQASSI